MFFEWSMPTARKTGTIHGNMCKICKIHGIRFFRIELYNWRSLWLWTTMRRCLPATWWSAQGAFVGKNRKIKMGIKKKMWKCTEMYGNAWKCPIPVDAFDHHWVWRSGRYCSCSCRSKILPLIFWSHRLIRSGFDGFASLIIQNARLNPITKF